MGNQFIVCLRLHCLVLHYNVETTALGSAGNCLHLFARIQTFRSFFKWLVNTVQYICYGMRLKQWIIFLIIWDCYNILRAMHAVSCFCCMLGFCRATETAVTTDQSSDPGLILEPAIKNLLEVANRSACVITVNFNGRFIL